MAAGLSPALARANVEEDSVRLRKEGETENYTEKELKEASYLGKLVGIIRMGKEVKIRHLMRKINLE